MLLLFDSKNFLDELTPVFFDPSLEDNGDIVVKTRNDMRRAEQNLLAAKLFREQAEVSYYEMYDAENAAKAVFQAAMEKFMDHKRKRKEANKGTMFWRMKRTTPEGKVLRSDLQQATQALRWTEAYLTRAWFAFEGAKADEDRARTMLNDSQSAYMAVWKHDKVAHEPFHWQSLNVVEGTTSVSPWSGYL